MIIFLVIVAFLNLLVAILIQFNGYDDSWFFISLALIVLLMGILDVLLDIKRKL